MVDLWGLVVWRLQMERNLLNKISGSTIYSFVMCPRQGWFMHYGILPEQDNMKLAEGRNIHEFTKQTRGHKEFVMDGVKVDRIERHGERVFLYEVKNSTSGYPAARMQMLFYLFKLKRAGIYATGILEIPRKNKRYTIKLTEKTRQELLDFLFQMIEVLENPTPPSPKKKKICKFCGYRHICFA